MSIRIIFSQLKICSVHIFDFGCMLNFCYLMNKIFWSAFGYNRDIFVSYVKNDVGLIPRICECLFSKMTDEDTNYRTEVR